MIRHLLGFNNNPPEGQVTFDSSDHIRFENGQNVSGHNYGCHRRVVIAKHVSNGIGYTVTIYNMDGPHPWRRGDNYQLLPKPMKIVNVAENIVELRGYGYDEAAIAMGVPRQFTSFADFGMVLTIEQNKIVQALLNLYDRNRSILYLP